MKKFLQLSVLITGILFMSACSKKDKTEDETTPSEQTTTTTTSEDGSSVTIEAGDKGGKVEVESDKGTDVNISIDKKGAEVEVEEKGTSVDVHVKDDGKKD